MSMTRKELRAKTIRVLKDVIEYLAFINVYLKGRGMDINTPLMKRLRKVKVALMEDV